MNTNNIKTQIFNSSCTRGIISDNNNLCRIYTIINIDLKLDLKNGSVKQ